MEMDVMELVIGIFIGVLLGGMLGHDITIKSVKAINKMQVDFMDEQSKKQKEPK